MLMKVRIQTCQNYPHTPTSYNIGLKGFGGSCIDFNGINILNLIFARSIFKKCAIVQIKMLCLSDLAENW